MKWMQEWKISRVNQPVCIHILQLCFLLCSSSLVKAYFFNTRRIKCGGELAKNFFDKTMRLKKDSDDDGGKTTSTCSIFHQPAYTLRDTHVNRHLATKNKMKSYILKTRGLSIKNSYYLAVIFNDILRTIKAREWSLLWIDFAQCVQWAAKYKVWCAKAKNIIYIPTKLLFYFCLMRLIVI